MRRRRVRSAPDRRGNAGATLTVVLAYSPDVVPGLGGVSLQLGYPPDRASLPGAGDLGTRITSLDPNAAVSANDCETLPHPAPTVPHTPCGSTLSVPLVEIGYAKIGDNVPDGPLVRVQFDCAAGTVLHPADLPCAVAVASDDVGNTIATDPITCSVRLASSVPPTTTTVTTAPPTTSTSPGPPTTTTTLPHVCGNGTVEGSETCDDGNSVDENDPSVHPNPSDTCPSNCTIGSCSAGTGATRDVSVNIAVPGSIVLGGITVFVDYPDGRVSIPGSGSGVTSSLKNVAGHSSPNDLDYGLIEGVVNVSPGIAPGRLFTVTFATCTGAPSVAAGDVHCVVKDASDTAGNDVPGVTCSVSIP